MTIAGRDALLPQPRAIDPGTVPGARPDPAAPRGAAARVPAAAAAAAETRRGEVEGSIAVIAPRRWLEPLRSSLAHLLGDSPGRVNVVEPMSTKGLEYDATVIVDPDQITEESPGGIRVLYVALTRAAHRMHILHLT